MGTSVPQLHIELVSMIEHSPDIESQIKTETTNIVSEYALEMPLLHTTDQHTALRGRVKEQQQKNGIQNTAHVKQPEK